MTDTQIHILKTAMDWAKAEMFSSMFFALFGIVFLFASASFWYLGKTETAKAFVIPLLVTGVLLLILGVGLVIANQWRLSTFFAADANALLASEIARADKTVSGYQKAVRIYLPAIIAICALALLVVRTANWQASMVAIIAMMAVIMLVDTNAATRMERYQHKLTEFVISK